MKYSGITVAALIRNHEGKVLMLTHKKHRGVWNLPGGVVEVGELPRIALKREVKEEIGVDIKIIKLIGFREKFWKNDKIYWVDLIYEVKIKKGKPKIIELSKHTKMEWRESDTLIRDIFAKSYAVPISVKGIVFENGFVWLRKNERNEWELPGGKMDEGEQPEQTVIRELKEELGFETEVIDIIQSHLYTIKTSKDEARGVLVITHLCRLLNKTSGFELNGEAGKTEFKKFPIKEVKNLKMPKFYKKAILRAWKK